MVEDHSVAIDAQITAHGSHFDLARRDGHFYSDKAPGSSAIAAPVLAIYEATHREPRSIERSLLFARTWVMIPISLLALLTLRALCRRLGLSPALSDASMIAVGLGSSMLHYGAALFGHVQLACAAILAVYALWRALHEQRDRLALVYFAAAGLAAAIAFAIEYQGACICLALACASLSHPSGRRPRAIIAALVGAAIPIALTLWYNDAAFGGPLQTSYAHLHHAHSRAIHERGLFGVGLPTLASLYGVLLGPARGALWCAPVLLMGTFGLPSLWARARWLAIYCAVAMAGYALIATGVGIWHGGWGFGPRFLVPVVVIAALPTSCLLDQLRAPLARAALAAWLSAAIVYNVVVTSAFPEIPPEITAPLPSVALPLIARGAPSPNLLSTTLSIHGLPSLLPLYLLSGALIFLLCRAVITHDRLRSGVLYVIVLFGALLALASHPETQPTEKQDKFVEFVAKLRQQPR